MTTRNNTNTRTLALATVIQTQSPSSGRPGDKAIVSSESIVEGWIGGGCSQSAVIKATREVLQTGQTCLIRIAPNGTWQPVDGIRDFSSGCLSGGSSLIFIEPLNVQSSMCILGNSPVARHLTELAGHLGFNVLLASPDLAKGDLSQHVRIMQNFDSVEGDYVVIATQGKNDLAALMAALNTDASYITLIASKKKTIALKLRLFEQGIVESQLDRLHGPAGLDIGAETPAEIALSILAEIVRIRRKGLVDVQSGKDDKNQTAVSTTESKSCCE